MQDIYNIFCIGRNYVEHVHELGNELPEEPVVFTKPTHALVTAKGQTISLPTNQGDVHYEAELVLKIGKDYKPGDSVDDVVSEMTIGLDLTLRDVQSKLKEKAHPWLRSKGFQNAAVLGEFFPFPGEENCKDTAYALYINDERVQLGDIKKMIFPLQTLIQFIGEHLGLKKGDIIYTGTPSGVGPLYDGDDVTLLWGEDVVGTVKVSKPDSIRR